MSLSSGICSSQAALINNQPNPKSGSFWNTAQNRFFLNLRIIEDLFCWKDTTFKNNKQLLQLYQVESEICRNNYEIKGHLPFLILLTKKQRLKSMTWFPQSHNLTVGPGYILISWLTGQFSCLPCHSHRVLWKWPNDFFCCDSFWLFTNAMFLQMLIYDLR